MAEVTKYFQVQVKAKGRDETEALEMANRAIAKVQMVYVAKDIQGTLATAWVSEVKSLVG